MFVYLPIFDREAVTTRVGVLGFVRTSFSIDELLRTTLIDGAHEGIAVELTDPDDSTILGSMTPVSGSAVNRR